MSYLLNPSILNPNPLKYGNVAVWLDGSDSSTITLSTGLPLPGRVARWADKSGRGNDFVQNTASKRPLYSNSSVFLDANGAYHLQNSSFSKNTNQLTAFAVVEQASRGTGTNIYGRWLSFYLDGGLDYNNLNSIILTDNTPNSGDIEVYRNSTTQVWLPKLTLNTKTVIGFRINGSNVKIYKGSTSSSGTLTSATNINTNRIRLGADTVEADSNINGRYYEVIIFDEALSDNQVLNTKIYLETKWFGDQLVFPT